MQTVTARPSVLVLLAAYNGARWIREQLESILAQEEVNLHIVVRDDGSTDETRAEVSAFGGDDRLELLHDTTPTGSAAQNFFTLIRANPLTDGTGFVAFSDQDDLWTHDKLRRACSVLQQDGSAGYSSATLALWPDGRESLVAQVSTLNATDFLFGGAGQGCTFVLSADFYRRARQFMMEHAKLIQKLHYHDWALYALARAWDLKWSFDPKPSVRYRQHGGNDTGARGSVNGMTTRLSLIKSGWYGAQLRSVADLCVAAAPSNTTITEWHARLSRSDSWPRRLEVARFCLRGGRRKRLDNVVVLAAALAGWI